MRPKRSSWSSQESSSASRQSCWGEDAQLSQLHEVNPNPAEG